MTTIIFAEQDGKIITGSDSQTTAGWRKSSSRPDDGKIFVNGGLIFGVSGTVRGANILQFMDIPVIDDYEPGWSSRKWMVTKFVPAVQKAFEEAKASGTDSDGCFDTGVHFLVGFKGQVFSVHGDLSVMSPAGNFFAAGSGSSYALGAMYAGADVKQALEAAANYDAASGAPFTIKDSVQWGIA